MLLELSKIRTDGGTQARVAVPEGTLEEYVQALIDKAVFPPVVVFFDGEHHWLADGFIRLAAHERTARDVIEADVREGTKRDAILHAAGANAEHGVRRTTADKERAVRMLLDDPEWADNSDRWIAEAARVGHPFVAKIRKAVASGKSATGIASSRSTTRRTSKDGRSRPAGQRRSGRSKKAGKAQASAPPAPEPSDNAAPEAPAGVPAQSTPDRKRGDDTPQTVGGKGIKLYEPDTALTGDDPAPDAEMAEMQAVNAKIESFCRGLMKYVKDNLPDDHWLRHHGARDGALRKFQDGCAMLRAKKCAALCPKCGDGKDPKGKDCPHCHGTRRLPKDILDSI